MLASNEELQAWATKWAERAEQHRLAAEFCDEQVARFMGKLAVEEPTPATAES